MVLEEGGRRAVPPPPVTVSPLRPRVSSSHTVAEDMKPGRKRGPRNVCKVVVVLTDPTRTLWEREPTKNTGELDKRSGESGTTTTTVEPTVPCLR